MEKMLNKSVLPEGTWRQQVGGKLILGASLRSLTKTIFLSVFFGVSLLPSLLILLNVGELDHFNSWVLVPFIIWILFTGLLFYQMLLSLFGKVEVVINQNQGKVFTGFGNIGFSRSFRISDIKDIREDHVSTPRKIYPAILIWAKRKILFGSGLSEESRNYLLGTLKKSLSNI